MDLKPTVKRDLSLFSVLAWKKGYLYYLEKKLGFSYPIIFHYDTRRVNFYHTQKDFDYFKKVITQKLIQDKKLFSKLNEQFIKDINQLKVESENISANNLTKIFNLIGKIMSFYIFVVSDSFVEKVPEALKSRHLSEGILYKVDENIPHHFLTLSELKAFLKNKKANYKKVDERKKGYIIDGKKLITDLSFADFCKQNNLINPEDSITQLVTELKGAIAHPGKVSGKVKIIHTRADLEKINEGDILVSIMTNITHITAATKAAAIVTDEGGVICHAAIMARELKKPCIVGTKHATKILVDDQLIEVDAEAGIVRILHSTL